MRWAAVVAIMGVSLAVAGAGPRDAEAADPGRWRLSAVDRIPIGYWQGLAPSGDGHVFWTGASEGVYRGGVDLAEQLRLPTAIPGSVKQADGFNHIGDPAWDPAGSGRLLLPLECYSPGAANGGNTCGRGGFGVMDGNLIWRYRVLLDTAAINKAMWVEVEPDRGLAWTSSGRDLLAYHLGDISAFRAAPDGEPLRPVYRLAGAVPASGVTGATFWKGRLLLAGDDGGSFQVWSVDVQEGHALDPRLEIERRIVGESEGLGVFDGLGGLLHWIVAPFTLSGRAPTYGSDGNALLTFVPASEAALEATVTPRSLRAGRPAALSVRVYHRFAGRTRPVARAVVRAGAWRAVTGEDGEAELRVRPREAGTLRVSARKHDLGLATSTLSVAPSIGGVLRRPPRVRLSAGSARTTISAARLIDCSGTAGCEARRPPRPRGCVAVKAGAPLRIELFRRPPRQVSVLLKSTDGRTFAAGRALPVGSQGLGWRMGLRASPRRGRLELVLVYPDGTGAQLVTRTSSAGC